MGHTSSVMPPSAPLSDAWDYMLITDEEWLSMAQTSNEVIGQWGRYVLEIIVTRLCALQ